MNTNKGKVRIAIPVNDRNGLLSEVSSHFGKAYGFMLVDSDGSYAAFMNPSEARQGGECAPVTALLDNGCDIILCHSMGRGAYERCQQAGFKVLKISDGNRVIDVLNRYNRDLHDAFGQEAICAHHHGHHAH